MFAFYLLTTLFLLVRLDLFQLLFDFDSFSFLFFREIVWNIVDASGEFKVCVRGQLAAVQA